jgi:nucleoside-diphosphate-sugar epimerase
MNILILGGTGNISSETASCLAESNHRVTVLTLGRRQVSDRYNHIMADRHDFSSLSSGIGNRMFDVVIDFLGYDPQQCRIAYETLKDKTGHYIHISSATVYRKPHEYLPVDENHLAGNPFSLYAQNKYSCEEYLGSIRNNNFPITIIRLSHTFGKTWIPSPLHGSDWTVSARILAGKPVIVHDKGMSLWTLTASSDIGNALAMLAGNKKAFGETYNLTSDEHLTWNAIYREIGLALGAESVIEHIPTTFLEIMDPAAAEKLRGDKMEHGVFDTIKIRKVIPEWFCRKSFRFAIRESVAWFREDAARQKVDAKKDAAIETIIKKWQEINR